MSRDESDCKHHFLQTCPGCDNHEEHEQGEEECEEQGPSGRYEDRFDRGSDPGDDESNRLITEAYKKGEL